MSDIIIENDGLKISRKSVKDVQLLVDGKYFKIKIIPNPDLKKLSFEKEDEHMIFKGSIHIK